MWIEFKCGNCGKALDSWHEPHDSGEFSLDISNLKCPKCKDPFLIKIMYNRG